MIISVYLDMGLAVLVSLAALTDLTSRRIPNLLLLTGFCGALLVNLLSPAPFTALLWALVGTTTGLLIFLPLYFLRGMAAGDVKFMATVGAFSTPIDTLYIAFIAVCFGGVMSLALVVANGRLRMLGANLSALLLMRIPAVSMPSSSVGSIPYGVAIACGTWFVIAQRYHWFAALASLV
jgi:prepilin peptidase CpaA